MQSSPWSSLLFALVFAGTWLCIGGLLAWAAGWPALAARFRRTGPVKGERFGAVSGSMIAAGSLPVGYRGTLWLVLGPGGFGLSVSFPFRFMSPPLFIPWAAVESVSRRRRWFVDTAEVRLRGLPNRINISGKAGQRLLAAYLGGTRAAQ